MLRCAARLSLRQLQGQGHLSAAAAGLSYTKSFTSDNQDHYAGEHLLVTEQDQGHMLEMLPSDPGEARRMLRALHRDGTLRETMADRIVRETLEAQAAEQERRMREAGKKELCEHGHEHDVCCGASKGDVEQD
ncbi:hypothetical protein D9Q98_008854 [Chlorella vulgaris]|uniref:Uncharacterized protein n=1 Tax=Chlorella vulgaris TaxID=3077 RepID=A0A9D4TIU5_CHLVU|nr:hypothetical protein D9Q98_008854 [Chlorella vulgaris]